MCTISITNTIFNVSELHRWMTDKNIILKVFHLDYIVFLNKIDT